MKITIDGKNPDIFAELDLPAKVERRYLLWGDYYQMELEVDDKLNIVGGRFVPLKEWKNA